MKNIKFVLFLLFIVQLAGCIVFNNVSYEITINEDGTGIAVLTIEDINTDASTNEAIDEDVKSIFEHGLKSQEFIDNQKNDGKIITSRKIVVDDGKLSAIVSYEFSEISRVEGMQFEDPYYYLTIPVEDSIISTNGQITKTAEYQRILWDKSVGVLKFKMFSDDTNREGLTSLAKFYKKED
jgi:hypothetical protein